MNNAPGDARTGAAVEHNRAGFKAQADELLAQFRHDSVALTNARGALSQKGRRAVSWVERGWPVFPCGRNKKPLIPKDDGGRGFYDATLDVAQVIAWWSIERNANIGSPTGKYGPDDALVDRNLVCVDHDDHHDAAGAFNELMRELGLERFATHRHKTPHGEHFFFYDLQPRTSNTQGAITKGVDTRGDDGYVILPGSIVDGMDYDILFDEVILSIPKELHAKLIASQNGRPSGKRKPIPGTDDDRVLDEGERHNEMIRYASRCASKNLDADEIVCLLYGWGSKTAKPYTSADAKELRDAARSAIQKFGKTGEQEHKDTSQWLVESTAQIAERGVPPLQWEINGLLPEDDGPAILFGPPGTLKTWFALHACYCAVTGSKFLGHFDVKQRPSAVYVNFDAGKVTFARRTLRLPPSDRLKIVSPDVYDAVQLQEVFLKHPNAFIVVDTFSDIYQFRRGDDPAEAMRNFLRGQVRALYQEFGCNGLVLDHPHRPREGQGVGDYYGSVQKEAAVRTMWQVDSLPSDDRSVARAKISCRKMSEDEKFEPIIARVDFRGDPILVGYDGTLSQSGRAPTEAPNDRELCAQVLAGVPGGMTARVIAQLTGLTRQRVLDALKAPEFTKHGEGPATRYRSKESS
jgi:hypothetical protein